MTQDPYEQARESSVPDPYGADGQSASMATPAPMPRRAGAAFIDIAIMAGLFSLFTMLFGETTDGDDGTELTLTGLPAVALFVVVLAYYIVLEAVQGKTVGKMILGLRTVREDGQPMTWGTSAARNVLRIVDGLFFYLVGFIVAMTNAKRQRIGDMLAKTIVVQD
jgi:uncharacterized RDD family membrane protein YckC